MTWAPDSNQRMCRDIRHSWTPWNAWWEGKQIIRQLRCSRCFSGKTQTLDLEGYVLKTSISYTYGYLRKKDGRLTAEEKTAIRLNNLGRLPLPVQEDSNG